MDHYIEIRLLPDPDFPVNVLMSALFSRLHRYLAKQGERRIGLSFPEYDKDRPTLGRVLRLHGDAERLEALRDGDWVRGMRDHMEMSRPLPVPDNALHRCVYRVQAMSNPERLRRRRMRRDGITEAQARERIPDSVAEFLDLPYVSLNSRSTGHRFRLFVALGPLRDHPEAGEFGGYGLSRTATVPWF